jgi:hypothetical protein
MEVTIVVVLASLVMLALLGFYINSQATWTDASSQAITQRELTTVIERITEKVHVAHHAVITNLDGQHQQLDLFDRSNTNLYTLTWNMADSLLYESAPDIAGGAHPILGSHVVTFLLSADSVVTVTDLTVRSATGRPMTTSSTMALMNR